MGRRSRRQLLVVGCWLLAVGCSVLEAAACSVPTVATRIYGLTDAVDDTVTGILVPPRDSAALAEAVIQLLTDDERCQTMGNSARQRAITDFSLERVSTALAEYLAHIAGAKQ